MPKVLVTERHLQDIADAIREKNGSGDQYRPGEMAAAIAAIPIVDTAESFSQENSSAAAYLRASDYEEDPGFTEESITDFEDDEDPTLEKPAGLEILVKKAGTILFTDENEGRSWSEEVGAGSYRAYNLTPGHCWRWCVLDGNGKTVQNGRALPTGRLRMIYLDGPHNFRDLGGWRCDGGRVRYGLLFRGAQLNHNGGTIATAADIRRLRNLNIRYELDLRTTAQTAGADGIPETQDDLTHSILGNDVYYLQFPYSDASYQAIASLTGGYAAQTAALLRRILENVLHGEPSYFHCQAGADRTAVIAYLIEGVLGVSQADMDRDYELTSFYPSYERTRLNTNWQALVSYLDTVQGTTLRDRFVQWWLGMGFSMAEINDFRAAMIAGTPETLREDDYSVQYKVFNQLPGGIASSNAAVKVNRKAAYSATITADTANNRAIKRITVRMGGVDITEMAVSLTPFTPGTTYAVSNQLSHVFNSNGAAESDGGAYLATLSVEVGYEIRTVSVTMGGVDVTETVYASGTISIAQVTGDLVITAEATEAVKTNMLKLAVDTDGSPYNGGAGYKEDYRLTSSGTESAQLGISVTGFIPCVKGRKLRFENIELPATNYSGYDMCYIAVYDSSKQCIKSNYSKDWYNLSDNHGEKDENNDFVSLEMNKGVSTELDNMAFVRISACAIGANSKIYIE